jgi:hypothetical protein
VCWVAAGAFGLSAQAGARPVVDSAGEHGFVTTTDTHDTQVVETTPLTGVAAADRVPSGSPRTPASRAGLLGVGAGPIRAHASPPCPHDARVASRTACVARRVVDLRREVFRTRPSRRVGGVEAALKLLA